jgi:hypothetical protein
VLQSAADPTLANTILQRRKDFQQPSIAKRILDTFGPNVLSVSILAPHPDSVPRLIIFFLLKANGEDW